MCTRAACRARPAYHLTSRHLRIFNVQSESVWSVFSGVVRLVDTQTRTLSDYLLLCHVHTL